MLWFVCIYQCADPSRYMVTVTCMELDVRDAPYLYIVSVCSVYLEIHFRISKCGECRLVAALQRIIYVMNFT